ncbi:hypothetical protein BLNAU_7292 [Blattamonas nauphoetae]|uniref:Uncharacterized protein n=1 Tax=Blattamonas nauphoetae TaxID=2049346 RepID=A0ABQ9Y290_9EUKA|nr:hypothetical protein BLNAU_7292 [Blattamonas nauphoetae]
MTRRSCLSNGSNSFLRTLLGFVQWPSQNLNSFISSKWNVPHIPAIPLPSTIGYLIVHLVDYPLNRRPFPSKRQNGLHNSAGTIGIGMASHLVPLLELRVNSIARRLIRPNTLPPLDTTLSTHTGVVVIFGA